ncbi:MAG: winged helix-turn-helix domain-containing protein [Acholeplasmataceae bacterium]
MKELETNQFQVKVLDPNEIRHFIGWSDYSFYMINLDQSDSINSANIQAIRKHTNAPLFVISDVDSEIVKSYYLDIGADYYLTSEIKVIETVALIRAALRRERKFQKDEQTEQEAITIGPLTIYPREYRVYHHNEEVNLTIREFNTLKLFFENKNETISRKQLGSLLYPSEEDVTDNAINIHMNRLRKKLSLKDHESPIETVWGIGYRIKKNLTNG